MKISKIYTPFHTPDFLNVQWSIKSRIYIEKKIVPLFRVRSVGFLSQRVVTWISDLGKDEGRHTLIHFPYFEHLYI